MSKFVNYEKRSVTLPPGCKDLIDILQAQRERIIADIVPVGGQPTITRNDSGTVKLSDIEKYVAIPFESKAASCDVRLGVSDETLEFGITRSEVMGINGSAVLKEDAVRERLMREFFLAHGLGAQHGHGPHARAVASVPVHLIYRITSLPSNAASFSTFAAGLFRHVCGLTDDSEMTFRHREFGRAA